MKQLIFITALFIIILSFCIINIHVIRHSTGEVIYLLQISKDCADTGDWENAREMSLSALAKWQSCQKYLTVVMNHRLIDDVTAEFSPMLLYISDEDESGFKSQNAVVIALLENILTSEGIALKNIF